MSRHFIDAGALERPRNGAAFAVINQQVDPDMWIEPDDVSHGAFELGVVANVVIAVRMVSKTRKRQNGERAGNER